MGKKFRILIPAYMYVIRYLSDESSSDCLVVESAHAGHRFVRAHVVVSVRVVLQQRVGRRSRSHLLLHGREGLGGRVRLLGGRVRLLGRWIGLLRVRLLGRIRHVRLLGRIRSLCQNKLSFLSNIVCIYYTFYKNTNKPLLL